MCTPCYMRYTANKNKICCCRRYGVDASWEAGGVATSRLIYIDYFKDGMLSARVLSRAMSSISVDLKALLLHFVVMTSSHRSKKFLK